MKLVYVAGKYTGKTPEETLENARRALEWGNKVWEMGFAPVVPHLSHWWDEHTPRSYEEWMTLDFHLLSRCDVLFRFPGRSLGADREIQFAYRNNIPVVFTLGDLERVKQWLS